MERCWSCGKAGVVTTLVQRTGGYYRERDCIWCKAHDSAPESMAAVLNQRLVNVTPHNSDTQGGG